MHESSDDDAEELEIHREVLDATRMSRVTHMPDVIRTNYPGVWPLMHNMTNAQLQLLVADVCYRHHSINCSSHAVCSARPDHGWGHPSLDMDAGEADAYCELIMYVAETVAFSPAARFLRDAQNGDQQPRGTEIQVRDVLKLPGEIRRLYPGVWPLVDKMSKSDLQRLVPFIQQHCLKYTCSREKICSVFPTYNLGVPHPYMNEQDAALYCEMIMHVARAVSTSPVAQFLWDRRGEKRGSVAEERARDRKYVDDAETIATWLDGGGPAQSGRVGRMWAHPETASRTNLSEGNLQTVDWQRARRRSDDRYATFEDKTQS